jgi:hypothetical protein
MELWNEWQLAETGMVKMAQKAGIKVILGNVGSGDIHRGDDSPPVG